MSREYVTVKKLVEIINSALSECKVYSGREIFEKEIIPLSNYQCNWLGPAFAYDIKPGTHPLYSEENEIIDKLRQKYNLVYPS